MPPIERSWSRPTPARLAPAPPAAPRPSLVRAVVALLAVLAGVLLPVGLAAAAPSTVDPGPAVEGFAPYQGQTGCDPTPKPGVVAFRDLVLAAYPGTGDSGISRACSVGGTSEHKEGRAWDWEVNTASPSDVRDAEDLLSWLLATDRHGNAAAMARRLGVMYVIWDSRIWKSYQADRGWQAYSGASPHTDHVHISFGWAGALGETSYWTGEVAPVRSSPLTASPSPTASPTASPSASPTPSPTPAALPSAAPSPSPSASPSASPSPEPTLEPTPQASWPGGAPHIHQTPPPDPRQAAVASLPGPWKRH